MKSPLQFLQILALAVGGAAVPRVFTAEAGKPASPADGALNASEAEVLLNLFQEKGLISKQDVEKARAELARRAAAAADPPPATRLKLADWMKSLELYGDARLRYEYRAGENPSGDRLERNRWRYRFRLGANLRFTDHLRAGMRLETGPGGRSSNVTIGDDVGPWGKDSDRIHLGLLFLTWEPTDWFTLTAGRQENPFTITSLVWDRDLTPEGLSESFKYTVGRFDLFANFGQFVYDDANPDNPLGSASYTDAYLLGQQVGARLKLNSNISVQVAPVLFAYSGGGDSFNARFVGDSASSSVGVNDLLVLEVPAEVRSKLGPVPLRVFGDFAVNLEGDKRAARAGFADWDDQVYAWQAGLEIGSARKRGGWSLRGFWQRADLFALDPNLVDTDVYDSRLNLEGFALQGIYAFTDFLTFTLTYAQADPANSVLPTLTAGDIKELNPLRQYRLLQADLSYRF